MSCLTRCPRKNAPGLVIMALRNLSMELGYFTHSEKGRQQYALTKIMTENILNYGYCVYARTFKSEDHPEAGPVWEWIEQNMEDVYARNGANLDGEGPGALRKIPQEDLQQLQKIFDHTGATRRIDTINRHSMEKAKEMGLDKVLISCVETNTASEKSIIKSRFKPSSAGYKQTEAPFPSSNATSFKILTAFKGASCSKTPAHSIKVIKS